MDVVPATLGGVDGENTSVQYLQNNSVWFLNLIQRPSTEVLQSVHTVCFIATLWTCDSMTPPLIPFSASTNRGDPSDPRRPLVVTRRGEAGLPGPQWQPGSKHGSAPFYWHGLPERKALPVPQGSLKGPKHPWCLQEQSGWDYSIEVFLLLLRILGKSSYCLALLE